MVGIIGDVVAKVHHPRTNRVDLANRLAAATDSALADHFIQPLNTDLSTAPDGRFVTWWPRVEVLTQADTSIPWTATGERLAQLHRVEATTTRLAALPRPGIFDRLRRAGERAQLLPPGHRRVLAPLADLLLGEAQVVTSAAGAGRPPAEGSGSVVHGDWHLGQLGQLGHRAVTQWRLLDVDDLGIGDPAWDLGRPAGFWAAGLLDDTSWAAFVTAYREHGGPAVPADGPVWERLDRAARWSVFIAAVRQLGERRLDDGEATQALWSACQQM